MKKLNFPDVDDKAILDQVCSNERVTNKELLIQHNQALKNAYDLYESWFSDDRFGSSFNNGELFEKLKTLYKSGPDDLSILSYLRKNVSKACCPMCGAFHPFTLEHVLPKQHFNEYTIYSRNLVPACSCNSNRGTETYDETSGGRIIHPYYDEFISGRLYVAKFSGDFQLPTLELKVLEEEHENIEILVFHLDNVILKNDIISHFEDLWSSVYEANPLDLFGFETESEITVQALEDKLDFFIKHNDSLARTKNNWNSFFYLGLRDDVNRLSRLVTHYVT